MPLSQIWFLKIICRTLAGLGSGLLLIAVLGSLSSLGNYKNPSPRPGERFDPDLVQTTPDIDSLLYFAQSKHPKLLNPEHPQEAMDILFKTVSGRFTHGHARHNLFSNWLLWGLGIFHPSFSSIRNSNTLLSKGHSAFCDQISYTLIALALKIGIPARHVGLNGHVVMEAWYDEKWHFYDPDYEVTGRIKEGNILSISEISKDARLVKQIYENSASPDALEHITSIIISRHDNTFMSYPPGARFNWKAQVLAYFSQISEVLKFLIPLTFLILYAFIKMYLKRKSFNLTV